MDRKYGLGFAHWAFADGWEFPERNGKWDPEKQLAASEQVEQPKKRSRKRKLSQCSDSRKRSKRRAEYAEKQKQKEEDEQIVNETQPYIFVEHQYFGLSGGNKIRCVAFFLVFGFHRRA